MHRGRRELRGRQVPKTTDSVAVDPVALLRDTPVRPTQSSLPLAAALLIGLAVSAAGLGWAMTPSEPTDQPTDQVVLPMAVGSLSATRIASSDDDRSRESVLTADLSGKPVKYGRYSVDASDGLHPMAQASVAVARAGGQPLLALPGETDDEVFANADVTCARSVQSSTHWTLCTRTDGELSVAVLGSAARELPLTVVAAGVEEIWKAQAR